jgi:hypothetical protein
VTWNRVVAWRHRPALGGERICYDDLSGIESPSISWEDVWPILFFVLLFAGIFGYALYVAPRKILQSNKLMQAPISGEANESGILMETEHTRSEFPWDVFLKGKIGKDIVLLLYQSIQVTNVFPREFFATQTDWQAFPELVRQHVPGAAPQARGGGFKMLKRLLLWMAIAFLLLFLWNLYHLP